MELIVADDSCVAQEDPVHFFSRVFFRIFSRGFISFFVLLSFFYICSDWNVRKVAHVAARMYWYSDYVGLLRGDMDAHGWFKKNQLSQQMTPRIWMYYSEALRII